MSNRPDFKSYLKYHCKEIFGTSYESIPVSCKSGKEYAMINTPWSKAIIWIYLATIISVGLILLSTPNLFPFASLVFVISIYIMKFAIYWLQYFLLRFEMLDDSDNLSMSHASKNDRPPIKDYLKHFFSSKSNTRIHNVYKSSDGQLYYEIQNKYSSSIIGIISLLLLIAWFLTILYMSIIHNVVTFIAIMLFILIASPLQYFFSKFHQVEHTKENIQGKCYTEEESEENKKKNSKASTFIIIGIVLVFLVVIAVPFIILIHNINNREYQTIPMAKETTFAEAYEIAQTYADEQCGDAHLLRFYIGINGEDAVKSRQPTHWELEFQDPPTGIFSDPNQTIELWKISETSMKADHDVPASNISMRNAPTLPVDVGEILDILETDLGISINDMNPSRIRIRGGALTRGHSPRNTCFVSIARDNTCTHYIVDFEDKTAQEIDYEPGYN